MSVTLNLTDEEAEELFRQLIGMPAVIRSSEPEGGDGSGDRIQSVRDKLAAQVD